MVRHDKKTSTTKCAHRGQRCNKGGLDTKYARMWTFHNFALAQNEGGKTYLDKTNPLQRWNSNSCQLLVVLV
jgi:hypothetical protein